MSKKLIFVMALSLVLVSGGLFSAQADCGFYPCGWYSNFYPCNWQLTTCGWHFPSCYSCCSACSKDTDRPNIDRPGDSHDRNTDTGRY